jgi:hypothetical protein
MTAHIAMTPVIRINFNMTCAPLRTDSCGSPVDYELSPFARALRR